MGDDEKLGLSHEGLENVEEAADVGIVKGSIHLIEDAKGSGFGLKDGKEERHGGHALLTTREKFDGAHLLARGLGDEVDPRLENVIGANKPQVRLAAIKEGLELALETLANLFEGASKLGAAGGVELLDRKSVV